LRDTRATRLLPRGRIAKWSKEQLDRLSTPELKALLANAERLKESEVAALCRELLAERRRGRPAAAREPAPRPARTLITSGRAFAMQGVTLRSRAWSRGGIRQDGVVVLALAADEVQKSAGVADSYLLWAPNVHGSRPWSDTRGGVERLEHCRIAHERGAAEGLLMYGKRAAGAAPEDDGASERRVDADHVLQLRVEKRGEEYWASCATPDPADAT
jgi:hypothetical protein